jgi:hypothetical protein
MKEVMAVRSRATPALVAYFFVPHLFVIKSLFSDSALFTDLTICSKG